MKYSDLLKSVYTNVEERGSYIFFNCLINAYQDPSWCLGTVSLCSLLSNMCFQISYLPLQKKKRNSNLVIVRNAMTLRNMFIWKQCRPFCLCSSIAPFSPCWLRWYPRHCIVHHEWLPGTLSKVAFMLSWWGPKCKSLSDMQENMTDNLFCSHVKLSFWNFRV